MKFKYVILGCVSVIALSLVFDLGLNLGRVCTDLILKKIETAMLPLNAMLFAVAFLASVGSVVYGNSDGDGEY